MNATVILEFPAGALFVLPLFAALAWSIWRQHRRGLERNRMIALGSMHRTGVRQLRPAAAGGDCINGRHRE